MKEVRISVVSMIPRFDLAARVTGMGLWLVIAVSAPASAQSWNLYGGYTSLPTISFADGAMSTTNGASVYLTMTGKSPTKFVVDTGSTGIIVTPDNFTPGPNDRAVGTGSQFYSSSGLLSTGTFYETNVVINNTATVASPGVPSVAGAALATAKVTVLLVTNQTCTIAGRSCTPSTNPTGVAYMGVGFDRGASSINPPAAYNNTNPFINITSLQSGSSISTLRPGYLITNSGVTLGLSNTADVNGNNPSSNFAFVKLTPNGANSGQPAPAWQQAPMTITVGGVTGSGQVLPDAGIGYSFLTPPPGYTLATSPCPNPPGGGNCITTASGAQIQVFLPGQSTPQPANYSYTLGVAGNPLNPNNTVEVIPNGSIFLNTGRQFFQGFDYLYDPIGGFVGYAWAGASGAIGQVTAGLSLTGNVDLQSGFANSLPTFLTGNTTLLQTGTGTISSVIAGSSSLTIGSGQVSLTGVNTYTGGTTVTGGATLTVGADSGMGAASGGLTLNSGTLQPTAALTSARQVTLGAGGGTFNTTSGNITLSTAVSGAGGLTKAGTGMLTLSGANSYMGGTTVNAGTLRLATGASLPATGALTVNGGTLDFNGNNVTIGSLAGAGGTLSLGASTLTVAETGSTTFAGTLTGTGGVTKTGTGTLNLTGANTYTGPTSVSGGRLAVNGSITSNVTVGSAGNLGGTGTITGTVTNNGIAAPGNSIGTLSVVGSYTQAAGSTYQVETNAAGQADRINVTGAPGTATINGGTVAVLPDASGPYAMSTTYTILNATGGVSGAFANATSSLPFLQPSLSYDSNNAYLTLKPGGFAIGAQTTNQAAVGRVLDRSVAGATGDFATVIGTLATFPLAQGQAAMDAISGQNYSGFGTANIGGGLMVMNVLGQQMSQARGGSGAGTRVALAQVCDVACEGEKPGPWSLWGSALGVTGSVAGNGTASTLTYNGGGIATGADYRVDPRFLVGLGLGFFSGNQYLSGFSGRGTTNSYLASLYASFTQSAFYLDAQAGYGYNDNQMTRQILIPGLQSRTATGRTGANQFLGQVEAGYRIDIYERAAASLTPFARFQATTVNQAAFNESGASSLSLNVAQQITNSARTVLGAELAGTIDAGWRDKLALQFRLGWAHEYADTSRPVTASFAGAPGAAFTVFGAAPQRDAATIGLAANTNIAERTALYFRYDGEVGNGTDNHAFSAGLRMTW